MSHFRFFPYRDTRDGDALIVHVGVDSEWDCEVCPQQNPGWRSHCEWCSQERGNWVCGCGHLNPRETHHCEVCGRGRSRE